MSEIDLVSAPQNSDQANGNVLRHRKHTLLVFIIPLFSASLTSSASLAHDLLSSPISQHSVCRSEISMGGASIGAGGSWPPLFEAKGDGGDIIWEYFIYHILLLHAFTVTSTLCRLYPGVWRITPSTIFRLAACRQRNNSNIARPR